VIMRVRHVTKEEGGNCERDEPLCGMVECGMVEYGEMSGIWESVEWCLLSGHGLQFAHSEPLNCVPFPFLFQS